MREVNLVCVSANANANKFYRMIERDDLSVEKHWGRVGSHGESSVTHGDYDRTLREKLKKGYVEVDVVASSAPSSSSSSSAVLSEVARKHLVSGVADSVLLSLIDRLVAINRHDIIGKSGGQIQVSEDGIVRTPLGVISTASIARARGILDGYEHAFAEDAKTTLLEDYLKLVPQKVNYRRGWDKTFFSGSNTIASQYQFLDQLEAAVQTQQDRIEAAAKAASEPESTEDEFADLFRFRVSVLEDSVEFDRINKFYEDSKNDRHGAARYKLKRVYKLGDVSGHDEVFAATSARVGNVKEMWHGSQAHNILSILRKGLFVPSSRSFDFHGRMFGDGVYLSNQSSKSLNYSHGMWDGRRNSQVFMFLAKVAMGHEYRPSSRYDDREAHSGKYQSVNIKGGTCGVLNHEAVVWDLDQLSLRYLLEFDS